MPLWQNLMWVGAGLLAVLVVSLMPGRLGRVLALLGLNAIAGLALLAAINVLASELFLPLNGLTLAVSSILGVPGVAALALLVAL